MSSITPSIYADLLSRLQSCVDFLRGEMTTDALLHVSYCIEHGEIEMAYESFVLSCIKENVACDRKVALELRSIGIALNMECESVFEANFWPAAERFFSKSNHGLS